MRRNLTVTRVVLSGLVAAAVAGCSGTSRNSSGETAAPPPGMEVLTAADVGIALTHDDVISRIDSYGFSSNAPADFAFYTGETDYPFVDVPNGRLFSIQVGRGVSPVAHYDYAVGIGDGHDAQTIAEAAAAPLIAKYSDFEVTTDESTGGEGETTSYTITLQSPDVTTGESGESPSEERWDVSAELESGVTDVARLTFSYAEFGGDALAPGIDVVPAGFRPAIDAQPVDAGLSDEQISRYSLMVRTGLADTWRFQELSVGFQLPAGTTAADAQELLQVLTDQGWTETDPNVDQIAASWAKGNSAFRVLNDEMSGIMGNAVILFVDLSDAPITPNDG